MATKTARSTNRRSPAKRGAKPTTQRSKPRPAPKSARGRSAAGSRTPNTAAGRPGRKTAARVAAGRPRAETAARGSGVASVGDDAVLAGSGRGWSEWFALLDAAGAQRWKHKEIAAYLYDELECPGWWNQMVAVGYEQARGLRAKNEAAGGFQVSCSRTIDVPVGAAYAAWAKESERRRWLGPAAIAVRKTTPDKTMRITWVDGVSSVEVYFYAKGAARSQVSVQHRKLASAKEVASMRGFWSGALERLRRRLEA